MKPIFSFLRRGLVALTVTFLAAITVPAAPTGIGPGFRGPIGLQLYSLRAQFKQDVPRTLDEVRDWGFKYAEAYADLLPAIKLAPEQLKAQLDARGINLVSSHFSYEQLRDHIEDVARDAEAMGLKYAGCAWIPHKGAFDEKTCREAIAVFNHAGEVLAKHGIKFFYHVHGFEFQPYQNGTLLDLMMKETKPKLVCYEMDIFWIVFPGRDPVKLLKQYGHRWELMHLKDMKKGTPTGSLTGGTDVNNDVAMGAGQIDMTAVLHAAKKDGVKWYFIEDESAASEQQIPESLRWLEQMK
jgi:sugar phosphate isomerase/epimerase